MKKIVVFLLTLLFVVSFVNAADAMGDCNIVFSKEKLLSNWGEDTDDLIKLNVSKMMPRDSIEKALDNLVSYCCDMKFLLSDSCSGVNNSAFYPESIYLFDHVLDVYLRRLDAKQENENGKDLLYNLDPDGSGKERRDFITAHGNAVNGSLPLEIQKKYEIFWKTTQKTPTYMEIYGVLLSVWKTEVESAISLYDTWTLFDKYNLACDISKYITEYSMESANLTQITTDEYNQCKALIDARINNEKIYTQTIMSQKGEKLLGSNMNVYLGTYFVKNELSDLLQKVFDMSTSFTEINKGVSKLIPECS